MLRWSAFFLVIALVAGAFGMYGVAGAAVGIAKVLFCCFLALFLITAIVGIAAERRLTHHDDHHLLHR